MPEVTEQTLSLLNNKLDGELYYDIIHRTIYATDASVYKEFPQAVAFPKNEADIRQLILFAIENKCSLIPRAAGTSLAGQGVGSGIVVDAGRYMNEILEINIEDKYVWVEPGVILEELSKKLAEFGLLFGPETSTANRCMIGGMVGNNACGLHSLIYGSTRDHTLEIEGLLSDGSKAHFKDLSIEELNKKKSQDTHEGSIYRKLHEILQSSFNQKEIIENYPDPEITRRNTGYALDLLLRHAPYKQNGDKFNLCTLLSGSEGTLVFTTKIKLNLVPLPPPHLALLCGHFSGIQETLQANLLVLENNPKAVELMDSTVLDCTKSNKDQEANRFFVEGEPRTILIIEFAEDSEAQLNTKLKKTINDLKAKNLGYAFPIVRNNDVNKVWNLRKAGLGLLSNIPGDEKSVTVIEDTAVHVEQLPEYIAEIEKVFEDNNMTCVYHAHISTGELHLRPVLNLKKSEDIEKFKMIAKETVAIVKKYRGSFSGEHGDGRLRGSFIKEFFGEHVYGLLKEMKHSFDPNNLFNPGKIIDCPPMDESLRYEPDQETPEFDTFFDFSSTQGFMRAIEKCNGSGDCRKSHIIGGTMCPSYQASMDERNSTRARANILREFLSKPDSASQNFDHPEIYEILDLCLSCKACKSECPSSVDMAKLKAEFMAHWYETHSIPLRTRLIANITSLNRLGALAPRLANLFMKGRVSSGIFKSLTGFAQQRSLPAISSRPFHRTVKKQLLRINPVNENIIGQVCLFIDEFTDYNDAHIGKQTVELLAQLGYQIILIPHEISARSFLSKGLLKQAKKIINSNIILLKEKISESVPLIGIEPSAILGFRDEYPDLCDSYLQDDARKIASYSFMIDEFLANEIELGKITQESFTTKKQHIMLHGHCQQKAVASTESTKIILSFPENYSVEEIPSGCCGMAGSFGYEKEHYELSMKVGELVLFPAVRKAPKDSLIAAGGTSCRHQIMDGTGREALHPIQILHQALIR
ncbi:MAG: FAD-binding protein [Bacteroidetes bacterium]|nr:FAD-binding protein [Bacteroidota bacterium]